MLSRKNSHQPVGAASAKGTLTTTSVAAASPAVSAHCLTLPARRHRKNNGMSSSSGYSFAAAPRPSSRPATSGRRRAHASSAVAVNAVAMASKLVKTCTIASGEIATSAASHGRRFSDRPVAHTVTSQASASQSAEMLKYTATGSAPGSQPDSATESQASVSFALIHWNSPVATGYSMYRVVSFAVPASSVHEVTYGKVSGSFRRSEL